MIKKYSYPECTIEVEYVPGLTYVGALYDHCGISSVKISNISDIGWNTITVSITGSFIRPSVRVYGGVPSGETSEIIPDRLDVRFDRICRLDENIDSEIRLTVSADDMKFDTVFLPLKVYNRNHFSGESGHFEELAAFVDPDHELVGKIVGTVSVPGNGQSDEFGMLRKKVEQIYCAAKDQGFSYRDVFFRADRGQDVSTCDVLVRQECGNTLDLALLFCSCLECIGIRSSLIYFDTQVLVGAWTDSAPIIEAAVTASAENIYGLIASDRPLLVLADPSGVATGKTFEDANYSANKLLLNEEPRYLVDIAAARRSGVVTMVRKDDETILQQDDRENAKTESILKPFVERNSTLAETCRNGEEDILTPMLSDSSQAGAVRKADSGVSMILNAPAGTGKVKTIVNIIANALCKNKRVLYVASDKALLDKVKCCIDAVVDESLESDMPNGFDGRRENIERFCEALHGQAADGLSLFDVIERYYGISGDLIELTSAKASEMDASQAYKVVEVLKSLDDIMSLYGKHPSRLPLVGIYPRVRTSRGQARIEAFLEEFPRFVRRAKRRERCIFNRWFFHHDAMHYLERVEQWNTFRRLVVIDDRLTVDIDRIEESVKRWYESRHLFEDWTPFADIVVELNRLGVFNVLDYFLEGHSGKETADAFLKGYYFARARNTINSKKILCDFDVSGHESDIKAFRRSIDGMVIRYRRKFKVADSRGLTTMSLADIDAKAENEAYDIVVIDDAGYVSAEDVAGVMDSAQQIVLAGDDRIAEPQSLLADAIAEGLPECNLEYHTRSRHESLVGFRNRIFYNGDLKTFASANDLERRVFYVNPRGMFDSVAKTNMTEALAVVEKIKSGYNAIRSIIVVAFTTEQYLLIKKLLDATVGKHDDIIKVMQLEDVRGNEECDELVLSVVYAPDKDGCVALDMGMLSKKGGERQLNKVLSLPSVELTVFCSLRPVHIPDDDTIPNGVRILRKLIEYSLCTWAGTDAEDSISAVVENIADKLSARGYETDLNVGRSVCKIDIAVKNPDDPSRYLFGIIVDGRNYASAYSVEDREIIVPDAFEDLGWNIKRVWTIDWFRNHDSVLDTLLK